MWRVLQALGVLALGANGAQLVVTTEGGDAKWMAGSYATLHAKVGDTLVFNYDQNHDVFKMSDMTCGNMGNTELANNTASPYTYTVTSADESAGTIYFGCSYSPKGSMSHCWAGQHLTVTTRTTTTTTTTTTSTTTTTAGATTTTTTVSGATTATNNTGGNNDNIGATTATMTGSSPRIVCHWGLPLVFAAASWFAASA